MKRIMEVENLDEKDIPKVNDGILVEITSERETPFHCSCINNTAKIMKLSSSTVRYAFDKRNSISPKELVEIMLFISNF